MVSELVRETIPLPPLTHTILATHYTNTLLTHTILTHTIPPFDAPPVLWLNIVP